MSADACGAMAFVFGAICPSEDPAPPPPPRNDDPRQRVALRAPVPAISILRPVSLGAALSFLLQR